MTVDEFLIWAEENPGRYELVDGEVHAMSPETVEHGEVKFAVQTALADAISARRLPCRMMPDGMTVRVDKFIAYEPDALVYCGTRHPRRQTEIPNPVIVVEVLSVSTRRIDLSKKLAGYFRVPTLMHYLIVDPTEPLVIHHVRQEAENILTRIYREGAISLDPPGLELALAEIYES